MNHKIASTTNTVFSVESDLQNKSYLGILFSGIGYTYRNPLLYYSRKILKELGTDYIGIDYKYHEDSTFSSLTDDDREKWWENDNRAVLKSILDIEDQYKGLILIGKSMGTSVIRRCLKEPRIKEKSICILLTPGNEWNEFCLELEQIENSILVIASKEDRYYIEGNNSILRKNRSIDIFEIEKGNHSLEINNFETDIDCLKNIMMKENEFIKGNIPEFG
jgi:hypothetical protein